MPVPIKEVRVADSNVTEHGCQAKTAKANEADGLRIWDRLTRQELFAIAGDTLRANQVAFSPDGTKLAAANVNGTVKIWDARPMK